MVTVYKATVGNDAVRPGLPMVERDAILAIVVHPGGDAWLGLEWTNGWQTFVTGGIEPGQTAAEAALAEVLQETGYRDAEVVATLPPTESLFWHGVKGVNRHAKFTNLVVRLRSLDRVVVAASEAALHRPRWLSRAEVEAFALPPSQRHSWRDLVATEDAGR